MDDCPCNSIRILKSDNGEFLIYGPASVEVIDREGDKIRASALQVSLPQLLKRGRLSLQHQDIIVGEILPERNIDGKLYKTEVLKNRLMVLGNIWDDTRASRDAREKIGKGIYKSYSISGEALDNPQRVCDSSGCYRDIAKLDAHAVTICEKGMNQLASFEVLQKTDSGGSIEYITIATPQSDMIASQKEAEVQKLTEEIPKPPATEAKKEAAPGAAPPEGAGAGNGGADARMSAICEKMDAICEKMMQMMGGMGKAQEPPAPPAQQQTQKADPATAAKELEDLKKKLAEQDELIKKLQNATVTRTPRPGGLSKSDLDPSKVAQLMKFSGDKNDESTKRLAKLTPQQIEAMTQEDDYETF